MRRDDARPGVAFVAGGGAVKAYAFHVGVLRGLEEQGFTFRSGLRWQPRCSPPGSREIDTYVGSSAGACVVASIASGHPVEQLRAALMGTARHAPRFGYRTLFVPVAPNPVRYLRRLGRRVRVGGLRPHHLLDVGGLLTTAGVERYFRRHVLPTNRFADLAADLFLTATQVNTSRKVVFGPVDSLPAGATYDAGRAYYDNVQISQAIAAAVAVPPIFAPYAITNPSSGKPFHYYDGEVREPLSAHVARDAGAKFVVASSIWSPYRYDERVGTLADLGMTTLAEQAIHQVIEQKVELDRRRARRYDALLERIRGRDAELGLPDERAEAFQEEVRRILEHPPNRSLYVTPDPADRTFFFDSSFRFNPALVDRCIEAGRRALRRALEQDPGFLPALDMELSAS
jgi:predicted acylesterase/phospholipase RssA